MRGTKKGTDNGYAQNDIRNARGAERHLQSVLSERHPQRVAPKRTSAMCVPRKVSAMCAPRKRFAVCGAQHHTSWKSDCRVTRRPACWGPLRSTTRSCMRCIRSRGTHTLACDAPHTRSVSSYAHVFGVTDTYRLLTRSRRLPPPPPTTLETCRGCSRGRGTH